MEPSLTFPGGYDEITDQEVRERGYCGNVVVTLSTGAKYILSFYDAESLLLDLKRMHERGELPYSDQGLVILDVVCHESMQAAVSRLHARGHFALMLPLHQWPETALGNFKRYL